MNNIEDANILSEDEKKEFLDKVEAKIGNQLTFKDYYEAQDIHSAPGINIEPAPKKKRILVVDDPISVQAEISNMLKEAGLSEDDVEIISSEEAKQRDGFVIDTSNKEAVNDTFKKASEKSSALGFLGIMLPYMMLRGMEMPYLSSSSSGSNSDVAKIWRGAHPSKDYNYLKTGARRKKPRLSRNEECPCRSGKKYKNCCINKKLEEVRNEA